MNGVGKWVSRVRNLSCSVVDKLEAHTPYFHCLLLTDR